MKDRSTALLRKFIEDWREPIENEEPIQGSDSVDYMVNFWHRAVKALEVKGDPAECSSTCSR